MNSVQRGFEYEAITARKTAQSGDINGMARHLSAAHALAVWADLSLLADYGRHEAECWQEYEQWKTTTQT